jgi:hypothetical protein
MLLALVEQFDRENLDDVDFAIALKRLNKMLWMNVDKLRQLVRHCGDDAISHPRADVYRLIHLQLERFEGPILGRLFEAVFAVAPDNVSNAIRTDALAWVWCACKDWKTQTPALAYPTIGWSEWLEKVGLLNWTDR